MPMLKRKMTKAGRKNSHAILEGGEIFDLGSEHEVTELGISEENDEEHDEESGNVECTSAQSGL